MSSGIEIEQQYLKRLGVNKLRPMQEEVILKMLGSDSNLITVMPTGGGKTLCFQYYSLAVKSLVVVVYPLNSLINDQKKRFEKVGIACAVLRGGQTKEQRTGEFDKLFKDNSNVIISNPETLIQKSVIQKLSAFQEISLVIDEAHTLVEWSETFRPKMLELGGVIRKLNISRILAFTATATDDVLNKLPIYYDNAKKYEKIKYSSNRNNTQYIAIKTLSRQYTLLSILRICQKPCVIFVNNRLVVESLAKFISEFFPNMEIMFYHAGLSKEKRREIEEWYYNSNNSILVTTCAFGMGVDKNNIRTSIHYKFPSDISSFLQESGRIGRDGQDSTSYTIIKESEIIYISSDKRRKLYNAMTNVKCVRKALLTLMGEDVSELEHSKQCCQIVDSFANTRYDDISIIVKDFVKKTNWFYTQNHSLLALAGIANKHCRFTWLIPYYGVFKNLDERIVAEAVDEIYLLHKKNTRDNLKLSRVFRIIKSFIKLF